MKSQLKHEKGLIRVDIKIKRGIFQGETLSLLIFILAINLLITLINKL